MALLWGCHWSTYRSVGGRLGIAIGNTNGKHVLVNRPRVLPLDWGIGRPRTSVARVAAPWPAFGRDTKEIASAISIKSPELAWTIQDIYNVRKELKAELLEGKSPIEAMLRELEENAFEFNYQVD